MYTHILYGTCKVQNFNNILKCVQQPVLNKKPERAAVLYKAGSFKLSTAFYCTK